MQESIVVRVFIVYLFMGSDFSPSVCKIMQRASSTVLGLLSSSTFKMFAFWFLGRVASDKILGRKLTDESN